MPTEPQKPVNDSTYDLDLDTLVAAKKKIKIRGELVEIEIPSLEKLLQLSTLGRDLQEVQNGLESLTEEQQAAKVEEAIARMRAAFEQLMPELKELNLNMDQLFALLNFVTKHAMPTENEELKKRGITLDSDQKKIPQD